MPNCKEKNKEGKNHTGVKYIHGSYKSSNIKFNTKSRKIQFQFDNYDIFIEKGTSMKTFFFIFLQKSDVILFCVFTEEDY